MKISPAVGWWGFSVLDSRATLTGHNQRRVMDTEQALTIDQAITTLATLRILLAEEGRDEGEIREGLNALEGFLDERI